MTRINLLEPHQLTDKHLMAEYRELPRVFTAVLKLQDQGKVPSDIDIPERYVLGKGHIKFFYNKLEWLRLRYVELSAELGKRGYNLDNVLFSAVCHSTTDLEPYWLGDYQPKPEEIYLNMVRLCKRSNLQSVLHEIRETETL